MLCNDMVVKQKLICLTFFSFIIIPSPLRGAQARGGISDFHHHNINGGAVVANIWRHHSLSPPRRRGPSKGGSFLALIKIDKKKIREGRKERDFYIFSSFRLKKLFLFLYLGIVLIILICYLATEHRTVLKVQSHEGGREGIV
jgi:hypothetical protein